MLQTVLLDNSSNNQFKNLRALHGPISGKLIQNKAFSRKYGNILRVLGRDTDRIHVWMSFPVKRYSSRPGKLKFRKISG